MADNKWKVAKNCIAVYLFLAGALFFIMNNLGLNYTFAQDRVQYIGSNDTRYAIYHNFVDYTLHGDDTMFWEGNVARNDSYAHFYCQRLNYRYSCSFSKSLFNAVEWSILGFKYSFHINSIFLLLSVYIVIYQMHYVRTVVNRIMSYYKIHRSHKWLVLGGLAISSILFLAWNFGSTYGEEIVYYEVVSSGFYHLIGLAEFVLFLILNIPYFIYSIGGIVLFSVQELIGLL